MTQAQKIAKEKFKKAIAYRKKTGATLKEAFAFVYGRKVSPVKKKAAPKKKAAVKKVGAVKKKSENKYKYFIQDSEAGNVIDKYITLSEAKKDLLKFEKDDKKEGIYKQNFYEIKSVNNKKNVGTIKKKAASKRISAIKIIEKGESKSTKAKSTYQQVRTKKGTYKGLKKISGLHNKRIVSGLPSYKDPDMARELELYADNDSLLYFQRRKPILINLSKKYKKGTYDVQKAAKLWRYYIDAALEKYNKEFGSRGDKWYDLMSVPDRNLLALEYAQNTKDEFDLGNFTEK
jgi:hypothetical protein